MVHIISFCSSSSSPHSAQIVSAVLSFYSRASCYTGVCSTSPGALSFSDWQISGWQLKQACSLNGIRWIRTGERNVVPWAWSCSTQGPTQKEQPEKWQLPSAWLILNGIEQQQWWLMLKKSLTLGSCRYSLHSDHEFLTGDEQARIKWVCLSWKVSSRHSLPRSEGHLHVGKSEIGRGAEHTSIELPEV